MSTDNIRMSDFYYRLPLSLIRFANYWGEDWRDMAETLSDSDEWCGERIRAIHDHVIEDVMAEELCDDPYVLGSFNADFLASVTGLPKEIIKTLQEAGKYEALGQHIIDSDHISGPHGLAAAYASADGYAHHFAHYDGEEHEFGEWRVFRIN